MVLCIWFISNTLIIMFYTNKFVNLISLLLTSFIFFSVCFFYNNYNIVKPSEMINKINIINEKNNDKEEKKEQKNVELGNWYIEIPTINLVAPIAEGTDSNTLNLKVGHFTDTAIEMGNIGLAGHNRGYEYNYFQNLKRLKKEDRILYTHNEFKKEYVVDVIEIIENSNWNYLKESEENKITLITCIENEPKYRRCIQAVELY